MKKRILVVDDDASVRESLRGLLQRNGYWVRVAADGEEAESSLSNERADLMVLDLEMPRRDGFDVFEEVSARFPHLPIIVITGLADQLDTKLIPGLDFLMEKPIDVNVFLRTVEFLLAESLEERAQRLCRERGAGPGYLALPLGGRRDEHLA